MTHIAGALAEDARKTTGEALQGALVDLVDLSLQAKQIHWNVVGKHFRSIHLQLDEVVATARQYADSVAERCVAIGVNPDARMHTLSQGSQLRTLDPGYLTDDDAVTAVSDRLGMIVTRMRQRVDDTAQPDPVSQDLLIGVTGALEKHHWMFQAQR